MRAETDTCKLCGEAFEVHPDDFGYIWTCQKCRHPERLCECGSDDVTLDWHIVSDQNGSLSPAPAWAVECAMCERTTAYFETPKEARDEWQAGHAEKVMQ